MLESEQVKDNMSLELRMCIKDLACYDPKPINYNATDGVGMAATDSSVRLPAVEVFPGRVSAKQKQLHWGREGNNPKSMGSHFAAHQFQRMLYDEGEDPEKLKALSNTQLAALWQQHRDRRHTAETFNWNAEGGDPARDAESFYHHDEIVMQTSTVMPAPETAARSPTSQPHLNIRTTTTVPSGNITTIANATCQSMNDTTRPPSGGGQPKRQSTKTGKNQAERERITNLAARVGRYPLSLPGSDNGKVLSMQRDLKGSTIAGKYNHGMIMQLLQDYGLVTPHAASMLNGPLAEYLVEQREILLKNNAVLQDPWTTERLEAYVADQEANSPTMNIDSLPQDPLTTERLKAHLPMVANQEASGSIDPRNRYDSPLRYAVSESSSTQTAPFVPNTAPAPIYQQGQVGTDWFESQNVQPASSGYLGNGGCFQNSHQQPGIPLQFFSQDYSHYLQTPNSEDANASSQTNNGYVSNLICQPDYLPELVHHTPTSDPAFQPTDSSRNASITEDIPIDPALY